MSEVTSPAVFGGWISLHDVAERLGVQLTNGQAWEVGQTVARRWADCVGRQPRKDLRTKKNGAGSHCFAVYPPEWATVLEGVIKAVQPALRGQRDLFDDC